MPAKRRPSIKPKNATDSCAMIFLISVCILTVLYDMIFLIPFLSPGFIGGLLCVFFLLFVLANITGNFLKLILIDTSIANVIATRETSSWSEYCPYCETTVPPRSYHCPVCNICILRHDHHCIFSGCCVGLVNHRFYMGLITHLWLGSFFTVFFNFYSGHLSSTVGGFDEANFWNHLLILPYLLIGKIQLVQFCVLLLSWIYLFGCLFVTGLLIHHWMLLVAGQTTWEKGAHVTKYQCRSKEENVTNVLGDNWLGTFVWFNNVSAVRGDGGKFYKCVSGSRRHLRPKKQS